MTAKIYLAGYQGKTPLQLAEAAERLDAVVFDIRFSPRSRVPQWNRGPLSKVLGARYTCCNELGNVNYKGGPVQIVNFDAGLDMIKNCAKPVILLCVCKNNDTCHRSEIGHRLTTLGFDVSELDWCDCANTSRQITLL